MKKVTVIFAILCAAALLLVGCVPQEEAQEHTHTLTHTEGYPATCLENGITENWFCMDCGKRFADAGAVKEITFADIEIIAPGHIAGEDDGDCTTAINCTVCGEVATPAKAHTPEEDDGTCLTAQNCTVCDQIAIPARDEHVATISPANCVNIALCDYCKTPFGELDPTNHRDDETKIRYADENTHETYYECCNTVVETGTHNGEATCRSYGYCTICATGYAEPDPTNHESDETYTIGIDGEKHGVYYSCCQTLKEEVEHTVDRPATCNQRAFCADCGNEFGEFNPENHAIPEARINWINGEYHEERYICCDTLVKTEAHNGEATCMHVAYCTVCKQNYGNYDMTNHESDEFIYEPAGPGAHTKFHACCRAVSVLTEACSGGTATCTEKAVCTACGTAYGEPDPENHDFGSGITCICGAKIEFTGVEVSNQYDLIDKGNGNYIAVVAPGDTGTDITFKFVGENLEYLTSDNTLLKTRSDNSVLGECEDPLKVMIETGFTGTVTNWKDGSWWEWEYSNDGGITWEGVRVEVKQG